jgi:hypothetical protein
MGLTARIFTNTWASPKVPLSKDSPLLRLLKSSTSSRFHGGTRAGRKRFHTERVPFRKVPPPSCGDLNLSINTGSTLWRIIQDPIPATTEDRPASIVNVPAISPIAWPSLTTSAWVGPFPNSGVVPVAEGVYIYDFTFCLCPVLAIPS